MRLVVDTTPLERALNRRSAVASKLNGALQRQRTGPASQRCCRTETPQAIRLYTAELHDLDERVAACVADLRAQAVAGPASKASGPLQRATSFAREVPIVGGWAPASAIRSCAFVSFSTLRDCSVATQSLITGRPFELLVEPAPRPEGVYWANIGMKHWRRQSGRVLSLCLTLALCLFWTVPMTFVAGVTEAVCACCTLPVRPPPPGPSRLASACGPSCLAASVCPHPLQAAEDKPHWASHQSCLPSPL